MEGQSSYSEVRIARARHASADRIVVEDHPEGYPQLTAFLNSDDDFLIARKYGFLRTRLLLYRQDELSVLEKGLLKLDNEDKQNRKRALQSRKYDEETDDNSENTRKALMVKIADKLKDYGKLPRSILPRLLGLKTGSR